ncbi:hypothetical protein V8G54_019579 [Vigna mungo]|uniref:Uncharacterized protein n=1 Tax=Vigna mungo TaxID=3915 RepID=A0AAQ3NDH4_VIGMU
MVDFSVLALHGGNGQLSPALKKRRGGYFTTSPFGINFEYARSFYILVNPDLLTVNIVRDQIHLIPELLYHIMRNLSRSGSLISRLRLDPLRDGDFIPLPGQLLRKYIAYARSYVFPSERQRSMDNHTILPHELIKEVLPLLVKSLLQFLLFLCLLYDLLDFLCMTGFKDVCSSFAHPVLTCSCNFDCQLDQY